MERGGCACAQQKRVVMLGKQSSSISLPSTQMGFSESLYLSGWHTIVENINVTRLGGQHLATLSEIKHIVMPPFQLRYLLFAMHSKPSTRKW